LLRDLHAQGHILVADGYVAAEAKRNITAKGTGDGGAYLQALLARIEVNAVHYTAAAGSAADWLPEKDRQVILLRYYQEMKVPEIAYVLKIPASNATSRLRRARDRLQKSLEGWFFDEE
jgi:DNA-directed RNA polymerase specialized sigma24 family protein